MGGWIGASGRTLNFTVRSHHVRAASALALVSVACFGAPTAEDFSQAERGDRAIARSLDIDYRKCAAVVLAYQFRDLTKGDSAYVSIMGEDPDQTTLASLRRTYSRTKPYSQAPRIQPEVRHSHTWTFYFGVLRAVASGEYTAKVGYACGSLCAGGTEYRLKRDGDSCSIVSSGIEWQS